MEKEKEKEKNKHKGEQIKQDWQTEDSCGRWWASLACAPMTHM